MNLSKLLMISAIFVLSMKAYGSDSRNISTLRDICQETIGKHAPELYTPEIIHQEIPDHIKNDLLQKRQLPIKAPIITPEVITSLINHKYWQDQWGYKWEVDGIKYSELNLLDNLSEMPNFDCKSSGDHVYEYGAVVFYEDFDPVDYVECTTSTYVTVSLKLK